MPIKPNRTHIVLPKEDKERIERLGMVILGDSNMSAIIRYLAREEAIRRGLPVEEQRELAIG